MSHEPLEYRDVLGYPGYRVGSNGTVWTCRKMVGCGRGPGGGFRAVLTDKWRELSPGKDRTGHRYVCLYANGSKDYPYVHNLVLTAFVGPCPDGMEACHFPDRDPANNCVDNLRWDTHAANCADKEIHGTVRRGVNHPLATLSTAVVNRIKVLRQGGLSYARIGAIVGVSGGHCRDICVGQSRRDS